MRILRSLGEGGVALALLLGLGVAFGGMGMAHGQGTAYIRVVHAAPAAPDVDVYVDNSKLLTNFQFGQVTGYVPLAAGSHQIAVTPTGQPPSAAVIKQQVTVNAGTNYTVAAVGAQGVTPGLVAFVDDNSVASGMAKVRVYHLSGNAGPVSVATGGQTVISNLAFENASSYLSVQPGNYTFVVTLLNSGTKASLSASLSANTVTSVFAVGVAGGSGATALKFATASVPGMPTAMPQTGFAPVGTGTTHGGGTSVVLYAGLAVLGLIALGGGAGIALARRRVS